MKKIFADTVVNIIDFNSAMIFMREPHYGEYGNEAITKTTPCRLHNGHYFDLRTGQEVKPREGACIWNVMPGTVFRYKDGEMILITRFIGDRSLGYGKISAQDFNPKSMVLRDIIDKPKEKIS